VYFTSTTGFNVRLLLPREIAAKALTLPPISFRSGSAMCVSCFGIHDCPRRYANEISLAYYFSCCVPFVSRIHQLLVSRIHKLRLSLTLP
jgi:hypothetical protein